MTSEASLPTVSGNELQRNNLREDVVRHIRDRILGGELAPGAKIDQDAIAERLGVSRLPIREALILLEAEGLVESLPRRGSYVSELTPEDIRDHYRVFAFVAGLVAERAAESITDEELDRLERALGRAERAEDAAEQARHDDEFHRIINASGTTLRLRSVYRSFAHALPSRMHHLHEGERERAEREHRELLDALKARDPERARAAIQDHIGASATYALRMLRAKGLWSDEGTAAG